MPLVLNPRFALTRHRSSVVLHDAVQAGGPGYVQRIPPAEALVLVLHQKPLSLADLAQTMTRLGYDSYVIAAVRAIIASYAARSVLVDPSRVDDRYRALAREYDPHDYLPDSRACPPQSRQFRLEAPIGFTFLSTLSCNRSCVYCYAGAGLVRHEDRLSSTRLRAVLDEAATLGIRSVNVSGGEPFLRQDLPDLLEYMLALGIQPTVSTKAALPRSVVMRLSRAGLKDIQVSLDSPDPHVANYLVGSPHYFTQVIETIRLLAGNGIRIHLNCVVMAHNVKQVPELAELADRLGVFELTLSPYSESMGRHDETLSAPPEDREWLSSLIPALCRKHPRLQVRWAGLASSKDPAAEPSRSGDSWVQSGPTCSIGLYGFVVLPSGKVSVCERLAYSPDFIVGDLRYQSIEEIWGSPVWESLCDPDRELYRGTACWECREFNACTTNRRRCMVRTRVAYGRYFGPDPSCPLLGGVGA